jgi:hypothetical protein
MKKASFFSAGFLTSILVLLSLFGCRKQNDCKPSNPTPDCLIQSITYSVAGQTDTISFTYNAAGNPVTGFRSAITQTFFNFYWRYDNRGRMTDLVLFTGRDTTTLFAAQAWYKFFYDQNDNIVLDTLTLLPIVVNGQLTGSYLNYRAIITYQYDNQHRVTRWVGAEEGDTLEDHSFAYGANGNMVGRPYDNKVNFYSTNKIWQFLGLDWSVNNPVDVNSYSYNSDKLPTSLVSLTGQPYEFFKIAGYDGIRADSAKIHYACEVPQAPIGHHY